MLTRLAPLDKDDSNGFDYLKEMLQDIDPCIKLEGSGSNGGDLKSFQEFYFSHYGIPGTPEFDARIKEINQQNQKNK